MDSTTVIFWAGLLVILGVSSLLIAPLIGLSDEDMDMDTMITTYNTAVTDAASEILGKERRRKKPWVKKMFSTSVMKGEI